MIWITRIVSDEVGGAITCWAETLQLYVSKKKINKLLMVYFNRKVPVLNSACKLGFYFYNRMVKLVLFKIRGI